MDVERVGLVDVEQVVHMLVVDLYEAALHQQLKLLPLLLNKPNTGNQAKTEPLLS